MSSGLVASMALPAHAVNAAPEASPPTAGVPVGSSAASANVFFTSPEGGLLALPAELAAQDAAVSAPAAATVDFGHSTFSLVATADDGDPETAPQTRRQQRVGAASTQDVATETTSAPSSSGSSAVAIAMRYLNVPYVWGGTTPRGFDCSGLTQYVYAQLGVSIPRTVAEQRSAVRIISRSQAHPGDLVFFGTSHVGIYLGGNRMIDAPHRGAVVNARAIYSANVAFGRA